MKEAFTWGGFKPLILTLLVLSLVGVDRLTLVIPKYGGFAFLLIAGISLVIFGVPFASLQVSPALDDRQQCSAVVRE